MHPIRRALIAAASLATLALPGLALAQAQGLAALLVWREADGRFAEAWTPALQELAL